MIVSWWCDWVEDRGLELLLEVLWRFVFLRGDWDVVGVCFFLGFFFGFIVLILILVVVRVNVCIC